MKKILSLIIISLLVSGTTISQNLLVLQPDSTQGKDARVNSLNNYTSGSSDELVISAWTFNTVDGIDREYLEFDLSSIPKDTIVQQASLYLYASDDLSTGNHSQLSGSNELLIQRVTTQWEEHTISWGTQPLTTEENQIITDTSTFELQDYVIDVTQLVQDMVNNPDSSFGFLFKLQTELKYRMVNFASSDHDVDSLHPKLVVYYGTGSSSSIENNKAELAINIFPNPAKNFIKISSESTDFIQVSMYDITGKLMKTYEFFNSEVMINIEDLSKGLYMFRIENKNSSYTRKIMVN